VSHVTYVTRSGAFAGAASATTVNLISRRCVERNERVQVEIMAAGAIAL